MPERVAIVGSRDYPDLSGVRSFVRSLPDDTTVISGGARGVDRTAEHMATVLGLSVVSYWPVKHADRWGIVRHTSCGHAATGAWKPSEDIWLPETFPTFAQAAYFRNGLIVDDCSRLVAFWTGESKGTRNTIRLAEEAGKPCEVHLPAGMSLPR